MKEKLCGRCYAVVEKLLPANCEPVEDALGMYHCPDCGAMCVSGAHPPLCQTCSDRKHPGFDEPDGSVRRDIPAPPVPRTTMPFSLEQLHAVKTIICHGPECPDGKTSAILLHDVLPNSELKFVQYGTDEHRNLPVTPGMLFCDFSPPAERVHEFVDAGAIVLDHHKGAKAIVDAFGVNGAFGDEATEPGVCGAVLAFRHVWLQLKPWGSADAYSIDTAQDFATLAGIRDTWQNKSPRWREAIIQSEMLFFYPIEHWLNIQEPFCRQAEGVWKERRQIATLLVEKHEVAVKNVLSKAWRFTTPKGTRVVCFEGTGLSSDAAEALGSEADLVIGFGFIVENKAQKMIVSARSHTGYDVLRVAKKYGGGGHTAAAGCNVMVEHAPNPYDLIEKLVNDFERD